MFKQINNFKIALSISLVLVITFVVFLPSIKNGFINWDDPQYVIRNVAIKDLSWANLKEAFSNFSVGNYLPLVITSYMFDYRLFGLNPSGYHLTNLILHLFNSFFVFWLIYILTRRISISTITAILFGIHPLHVESVAWISERKDVLYAFFYLASAICYVYYLRKQKIEKYYFLCLGLFILSLLSKAMAITLPAVLLLVDYFIYRKPSKGLIADKIPFFILSFIFGAIAIIGQYSAGAVRSENELGFLRKIGVASYNLVFYLYKIFAPLKLSCFYVYPDIENIAFNQIFLYSFLISFVLLISVLFSSWHTRKAIFGGVFFAVTLSPILQFLPIGGTVVADRYLYVASIGIFYLIGEGFVWLLAKKLQHFYIMRILFLAFLITAVCILSILTWNRCKVWKDSITFWSDVLNKYPKGAVVVYHNFGNAYNEAGEYKKAIVMFKKSIEADPGFVNAYCGLASAYNSLGEKKEAINFYRQAIKIDPNLAEAYCGLGAIYNSMGDEKYAEEMFRQSLKLNPGYIPAYHNLVNLYKIEGNKEGVISLYEKAILYNVKYLDAFLNIANLYCDKGDNRRAIILYQKAVEINPRGIDAYVNLGRLYCIAGNYRKAMKVLKKALELNPDLGITHNNLAAAYFYTKQYDLAIRHCDRAIALGYKVEPKLVELLKPYRK